MKQRKPRSAAHRAKCVAKLDAVNADPAAVARRTARRWTPERKAEQSARMAAMNADPAFQRAREASDTMGRPGGTVTIPEHAHPIVKGLFARMIDERASYERVAAPSGIGIPTLTGWRFRHMPLIDTIDAALNVFGLQIAIVPSGTRDDHGFHRPQKRKAESHV